MENPAAFRTAISALDVDDVQSLNEPTAVAAVGPFWVLVSIALINESRLIGLVDLLTYMNMCASWFASMLGVCMATVVVVAGQANQSNLLVRLREADGKSQKLKVRLSRVKKEDKDCVDERKQRIKAN